MKKTIMAFLFLVLMGILPATAETWNELIQRTMTVQRNFNIGIDIGTPSTWSFDKWGALIASNTWLETAYENIYRNATNLTQNERDRFWRLWQNQKSNSSPALMRVIELEFFSANDIRRIDERGRYWMNHLINGGIITFN